MAGISSSKFRLESVEEKELDATVEDTSFFNKLCSISLQLTGYQL